MHKTSTAVKKNSFQLMAFLEQILHPSHKKIPNFWSMWFLSASVAIVIALLLWLPQFGTLPSGLNRDEAALGYNAYSLLKTGKDEWAKSWPISITSFGDQKLPGYVYTLIPFIAVFGLEAWVIRLPSLLAGLCVVIGMGLIAIQLSKSFGFSDTLRLVSSFFVMLLLAISPWHMHFSRVAYESHLAMALFVLGTLAFLSGIESAKVSTQRILLASAALLWSLTVLTYHSYHIFTPLFILALGIIYFPSLKKVNPVTLILSFLIGLSVVSLLFTGGVMQANSVKSRGISPFSTDKLLGQATEYRSLEVFPPFLSKVLFNKITEGSVVFAQNYVKTISGEFFFIHGSGHGDHNPANMNNMHLFLAPLIFLGVLGLWQHKNQKAAQLLIAWLLIALVPSSLTISSLHEVRIAAVFPVLELVAVIGLVYLFSQISSVWLKRTVAIVMIVIVLLSVIRTFYGYTLLAPRTAVDNYPYHELAQVIYSYEQQGYPVITQSFSSSPYIWYLMENKIDPVIAQTQTEHYEASDQGFLHVKRVGNVYFETINWEDLKQRSRNQALVLVFKPDEMSEDQQSSNFELLETIKNKQGEVVYNVWKMKF